MFKITHEYLMITEKGHLSVTQLTESEFPKYILNCLLA